MKAISFELSGKTAIFKKPDVNSYAYFTYNNIHKPALLGLLGAIIGLGGYTKLYDGNKGLKNDSSDYNDGFPEFYEKLKDLKISIIPLAKNGYFSKKIQIFNNSVGYASEETGGNLIVREQWLENPKWQIMILENDSIEYEKIKNYLLNKKAVYIPYLGKNDHFANIAKVSEIELSENLFLDDGLYVDSLFIKKGDINGCEKEGELPFIFQEISPISLQKDFHFYEYATLCFSNCELDEKPESCFSLKNKNYIFF
ncbi:MAG: type I-B CRISPR-associated protein Cas5b [Campylobacteraceae bacterium]|jgi:CRISPR-associated protein Cas5h|nr:type I-B CRISPR-associated protein Cas5b [Campylobacteraceae bacterium]